MSGWTMSTSLAKTPVLSCIIHAKKSALGYAAMCSYCYWEIARGSEVPRCRATAAPFWAAEGPWAPRGSRRSSLLERRQERRQSSGFEDLLLLRLRFLIQ
jgi:hypothetical protein